MNNSTKNISSIFEVIGLDDESNKKIKDAIATQVLENLKKTKTDRQYCKECDCVLRWDESETLCKSCEDRIEKEK